MTRPPPGTAILFIHDSAETMGMPRSSGCDRRKDLASNDFRIALDQIAKAPTDPIQRLLVRRLGSFPSLK